MAIKMELIAFVIDHRFCYIDQSVQVNRLLAELFNKIYVERWTRRHSWKRRKYGDPRCFNWALKTQDYNLLSQSLPAMVHAEFLLDLKTKLLEDGKLEAFQQIGSRVYGFKTGALDKALAREDSKCVQVMLDHIQTFGTEFQIFRVRSIIGQYTLASGKFWALEMAFETFPNRRREIYQEAVSMGWTELVAKLAPKLN